MVPAPEYLSLRMAAAQISPISVCSAICSASSTSILKYLTVLLASRGAVTAVRHQDSLVLQ